MDDTLVLSGIQSFRTYHSHVVPRPTGVASRVLSECRTRKGQWEHELAYSDSDYRQVMS